LAKQRNWIREAPMPWLGIVYIEHSDTYAGRYEAQGEGVFIIARERDFLTIQVPADWGLPKLRLRPEGLRDFFASELPLRVTFQTDSDRRVNGLLVYPPRGQQGKRAKRMSSDR
jgi:hypothetical protein